MYLPDLQNVSTVPVTRLVLELIDTERVIGEPGQLARQIAERLHVHEGAVRSAIATVFDRRQIKKIYIGTWLVGIEAFNHRDRTPAQKKEWRDLHVEGAKWRHRKP